MKINGYDVLTSEQALKSFLRRNFVFGVTKPPEYPCIVNVYLDTSEDPYLEYTTLAQVKQMEEALLKAREQMPKSTGGG